MSDTLKNKTILGADCQMSGEFWLDNDAVIMGQFSGTLCVNGVLSLAPSAQVTGTIIAGTLLLAGHVQADIVAKDSVELAAGSKISGRLFTPRLSVADNVALEAVACVGPNALQAAAGLIEDAEHQTQRSGDETGSIQQDHTQPDQGANPIQLTPDIDPAQNHEAAVTHAVKDSVTTLPDALEKIFQRRRAKVLAGNKTAPNRSDHTQRDPHVSTNPTRSAA